MPTAFAYVHGYLLPRRRPLGGVNRRRKGTADSLAALKPIHATRLEIAPVHIISANLCAHTGADIRRWAMKNGTELCFTPTPPEPVPDPHRRHFPVPRADTRSHIALHDSEGPPHLNSQTRSI